MPEAKENQEQPKDAMAEADRKLAETLQTPIIKEEAERALADIDVDRAKLSIIRQKWSAQATQYQLQLAALDERLLAMDLDRAVIFRRLLNSAPQEAADAPEGN